MDYLIVSGLVAEVVILSRLDRRVFGTWLTPFNLLAYPYMVVAVSAYLLAPVLDFVPVYTPSILIWSVGLFFFWAVGVFLGWGFFGGKRVPHAFAFNESSSFDEVSATRLATGLAWISMPLLAYGLYRSQVEAGGWTNIGTLDFKMAYSQGMSSHAVVLACPLMVLLVGTYQKGRKLQLLTICGLLLFLLVSQVKGTLLAPLIGALVFRVARGKLKLSLKKLSIAVAVFFALFNGVYVIGLSSADTSLWTDSEIYSELGRHFLFYLWAGVLSLSEALRSGVGTVGGPWYVVFSPFVNLYRYFLSAGPLVPAGSPHELGANPDLNFVGFQGANVYTMLGTLYFYLGPFAAVLVLLGTSFLYYGVLVVCRLSTNVWYLTLYCVLASWLVFGFFEYYFWQLTFIETIFYCLVLAAMQRIFAQYKSHTAYVGSLLRPLP